MASKIGRKPNKTERREIRLQKARQWVLTYEGAHIVRAYRKRFRVDPKCTLADLGEIGALQPEKLAVMKQNEEIRLQKKREEREAKREGEFFERFPDSDDRFFYIAGYTSGGAPYGVTWDEMGLEPYELPYDMTERRPSKQPKPDKPHGHYCKICGERKANERFSGRGHAAHICKECASLPLVKRNEMEAVQKISGMAFRYLSKTEIKWLRGKMNDSRPEVRDAAREAYNIKFPNHDQELKKLAELKKPVLFSELADDRKAEAIERLEVLIGDFFEYAEYIPEDEDRDEILAQLCEDVSETLNQWEPEPYDPASEYDPRFDFGPEVSFDERIALINEILEADAEEYDPYAEPEEPEPEPQKELIVDGGLKAVYDEIVSQFLADLKADGIELPTFMDSLLVVETERLKIRRFYEKDLGPLWAIMKKPEVMYAWESGFKKRETKKWLNNQYTRYHKDGYGYFAVTLKDSGRLIGQAGLIKQIINGETAVEIGYIFDDTVWGQGYAIEAARACVDLAFNQLGVDKLYATIRPDNTASVRLAVKLGMRKTGEYTKIYKDIEMPHDIYLLENIREMSLA